MSLIDTVIDTSEVLDLLAYAMVQKYALSHDIPVAEFSTPRVLVSAEARYNIANFDTVAESSFTNGAVTCKCDATSTIHNILLHLLKDFLVDDEDVYRSATNTALGMHNLLSVDRHFYSDLPKVYFLILDGEKILNCWKAFVYLWEIGDATAWTSPGGPWIFPLHIEEAMFVLDATAPFAKIKPAYLGPSDSQLIYLVNGFTVEDIAWYKELSLRPSSAPTITYTRTIKSFNFGEGSFNGVTFFEYLERSVESLKKLSDYFSKEKYKISNFLSTPQGERLLRSPALFYVHRSSKGFESKDSYSANVVTRIRGD